MSQLADDVSGRPLGRYRLESFLGEGGMGRVYRAFDPTLGRAVAIKILPPALVHDRDRLERFVREARTASSLNHPNVVTIYEIGSEGETHFIAMELLDGETLRDRGKLELRRAIDLIAQVADGVAAAHAAGVIHRDLKPENIMITKSGFAKVLDFGLAKLRETPAFADSATMKKTDPGTVMGSVGYMSPEQATGRDVDHRSDIFALGCILYEAASGRRAFSGNSSIDTLHKIIHDDPQPLRELAPDTPPELQRIVRKCLAKDPDERYQSAKELSIDLRTLRRDFESQPHMATVAPARRSRAMGIGALVAAAVVIAAIAIPLLRHAPAKTTPAMSITRITASGNVIGSTISPNGQYVGYAYSEAGKQNVWVKQLSTGSVLQLTPPAQVGVWGVGFSSDSQSIYYVIKSTSDKTGGMYQVSILGGASRKILSDIESAPTPSPDGKQLAFTRIGAGGRSSIVIANADGSGERTLAAKSPPEYFAPIFFGSPAWSPDGKLIATPLRRRDSFQLVGVSVIDGTQRDLSRDPMVFVGRAAWLPDMSGLIAVGAAGSKQAPRQLWSISYPDGQRKQLTNDLFEYRDVSLSVDGSSIVAIASDQSAGVYLFSDGAPVRRLTSGKYDGLRGVAAADDGIVYTSLESGRWNLWSCDLSGGNARPLLSGDVVDAEAPAISPDGRYVVFGEQSNSGWSLTRINRDGSGAKELCPIAPSGRNPGTPTIGRDGFVYFHDAPDGVERLWRVSIDGGRATPLHVDGSSASISPDAKSIVYELNDATSIAIAPATGGQPSRTFNNVTMTSYSMARWTPDGKAILHNAGWNDRKNVWIQPLDGSPPHPVTRFDDQYVLMFDRTPDGKSLVVVRGVLSRDAVLIKNFR